MVGEGVYIPSVDAKDLYTSNNYINTPIGYTVRKGTDGKYNTRKFINTFDYSLDLIYLRELYEKKYRRKDFSKRLDFKSYTHQVINVTFKFAVRSWNKLGRYYAKLGYNITGGKFEDCIMRDENGEIVAVCTETPVEITDLQKIHQSL